MPPAEDFQNRGLESPGHGRGQPFKASVRWVRGEGVGDGAFGAGVVGMEGGVAAGGLGGCGAAVGAEEEGICICMCMCVGVGVDTIGWVLGLWFVCEKSDG